MQDESTLRLAPENKTAYRGGTCCLRLLLYQGFGHFEWHYQVCSTRCVQLSMSLHWAASATTTLTLNWPLRKTVWQALVAYPYSRPYVCAFMCGCLSLYHVGIRPFALVLITLCCLHRPRNLPPLKCGFKKRGLTHLLLSFMPYPPGQPIPKVPVLVAPPCPPKLVHLPPIPAG